jgi:TolB-like protein
MYHFEGFTLDASQLELRAGERRIDVQPQVFSLITYLVENGDRVVTKDEIFDEVWDGRIVSDGTLNARVNAARRALGDDGKAQKIIRTFPRRGFRFVAAVTEEGTAHPNAFQSEPAPVLDVPLAISLPSIAILPFNNLSNDPEQEYFADGLTEDLITDLSKNTDLFVIARNSSFAYKGTSPDIREVGQQLGVAHVLEGSVRKAGNRVRINAQLADALTGGHVWADRYDSDMEDIFALQDKITSQIVTALEANLAPGTVVGSRTTKSTEAYELFLRARATFYRFTPAAFQESIRLSEQAVAIDPDFADAWAGMVFPHQSGWSFMWQGYDDAIEKGLEVGRRAVELAPGSSLCQSRFGWVNAIVGDHDAALDHFEKAIAIAPNDAEVHAYFGDALNFSGNSVRAIEMVEAALRFDPFIPPNCAYHMGHALFLLERYEEAEAHVRDCIDMAPGFPPAQLTMAALLSETGREDEAKQQIISLLETHPQITVMKFNNRYSYKDDKTRHRILAGLRAAGLPED